MGRVELGLPGTMAKVTERIKGGLREVGVWGEGEDAEFVWASSTDKAQLPAPRVPADSDSKRPIDEIAVVELAGASRYIIDANLSMDQDDFLKEVAKLFGSARPSDKALQRLRVAMELAAKTGVVQLQGSKVVAP